jgi:CDP-4-dehydro-6-deoxyglucose reductase
MPTALLSNGKTFEAPAELSLLDAARASGLALEHSCRTGRCGSCRAKLLSGTVVALRPDLSLTPAERGNGWLLTCASAATSDVSLDIEDLGMSADIVVKTLPSRIASLMRLAPDVMQVQLRMPPKAQFRYLPGQYIDVISKHGQRRSYSIANLRSHEGNLELHIREVPQGKMSQYWFDEAQPNDLLRFEGPRGTFFLRDVAELDLVFLATGTGIAPIKAMLAQLGGATAGPQPRSVHLLWGGRRAADLYWQPESTLTGLRYTPVLSRPDADWAGARGHVQDILLAAPRGWDRTVVYACGASAMIEGARLALTAAGLPAKRFFADAFVSSSN